MSFKKHISLGLAWLFIAVTFFTSALILMGRIMPYFDAVQATGLDFISLPPIQKLNTLNDGRFMSISHINNNSGEDVKVLTFRQSDMSFYGEKSYISHLDPLLTGLYKSNTEAGAIIHLKELGVTHLRVPNYPIPVIYNTVLARLLANPLFLELQFDAGLYRIYRIKAGDAEPTEQWPNSTVLERSWYEYMAGFMLNDSPIKIGTGLEVRGFNKLGSRVPDKLLVYCPGSPAYFPLGCDEKLKLDNDKIVDVDGMFEGKVTLAIYYYDHNRQLMSRSYLSHYVGKSKNMVLSGVVPNKEGASYFRPVLLMGKRSRAKMNSVKAHDFLSQNAYLKKTDARKLGWAVVGDRLENVYWGINDSGHFVYRSDVALDGSVQFPIFMATSMLDSIKLELSGVGEFDVELEAYCNLKRCYKRFELQPIFLDGDWSGEMVFPNEFVDSFKSMQMELNGEQSASPYRNVKATEYSFRLILKNKLDKKLFKTRFMKRKVEVKNIDYVVTEHWGLN